MRHDAIVRGRPRRPFLPSSAKTTGQRLAGTKRSTLGYMVGVRSRLASRGGDGMAAPPPKEPGVTRRFPST
jgi:hypothetical protein